MGILRDELEGDVGSVPRCATCGSERVVKEAWVCWNPEFALWELEDTHDQAFCKSCESATSLVWARQEIPPNQRIRELNDRFRMHGEGRGSIMLTSGVQERGGKFAVSAIQAVRQFESFSEDNDPWGEHDFGAIELEGERCRNGAFGESSTFRLFVSMI